MTTLVRALKELHKLFKGPAANTPSPSLDDTLLQSILAEDIRRADLVKKDIARVQDFIVHTFEAIDSGKYENAEMLWNRADNIVRTIIQDHLKGRT